MRPILFTCGFVVCLPSVAHAGEILDISKLEHTIQPFHCKFESIERLEKQIIIAVRITNTDKLKFASSNQATDKFRLSYSGALMDNNGNNYNVTAKGEGLGKVLPGESGVMRIHLPVPIKQADYLILRVGSKTKALPITLYKIDKKHWAEGK